MKIPQRVSILFLFVFLLTGLFVGKLYGSDDDFPGSNGDPLITKSYLEDRLKKNSGGSHFQKVQLRKNQILLAEEGSEILVYKGNGRVTGRAGLVNMSRGVLFEKGNSIVKYQLFLAPSENCGIIANDKMIVFVSGGYQIK